MTTKSRAELFDQVIVYETSSVSKWFHEWTGTFREWLNDNILGMDETELLPDHDIAGCFNLILGKLDIDHYIGNAGLGGLWRIRLLSDYGIWDVFRELQDSHNQLVDNAFDQRHRAMQREIKACDDLVDCYEDNYKEILLNALYTSAARVMGCLNAPERRYGEFSMDDRNCVLFTQDTGASLFIPTDDIRLISLENRSMMMWLKRRDK